MVSWLVLQSWFHLQVLCGTESKIVIGKLGFLVLEVGPLAIKNCMVREEFVLEFNPKFRLH